MSRKEYFSVGKILGTRGINGELKVQSWSDSLEDFRSIKNIYLDLESKPLDIAQLRIHKSHILMTLKSINNRNMAEKLIGKILYARREDIPIGDNRYFIEDLKGCLVIDYSSSKVYGILKDVINTGANDIYVINSESKKEYLVPIIDGTIKNINLESNQIHINPIRGIFDED